MPRWFEVGRRLPDELDALEREGIKYTVDEEARARGVLSLELTLPSGVWDGPERLRATYPEEYPYFRPLVVAPEFELRRHQNPFQGNLCLLGRSTLHWDVDATLADHLIEQLPKVLEAARRGDEAIAGDASEQAEPFSEYYAYEPNALVLIDPGMEIPREYQGGCLELKVSDRQPILRAVLVRVWGRDRNVLWEADARIAALFGSESVIGPWVRLPEPLPHQNAREGLAWLGEKGVRLERPRRGRKNKRAVKAMGVMFPEETAPGNHGNGWLFAVRGLDKRGREGRYYARAMRYSREALVERVPELRPLHEKTVGLVGLGCVGAPAALELMRAGIGALRVMDHDFVDAAATVRWPFGVAAAGQRKAECVQRFAAAHYPFTQVEAFIHQIGQVGLGAAEGVDPEIGVVDRFFENLDMVVDASAEFAVQHYLADRARDLGIPFVHLSGTHGGWGGLVFRVISGQTEGCWQCLRHGIDDGSLPSPPEAEAAPWVQPQGCGDPTFTGAGFDLGQASLQAVRLSVATLCSGPNGYPDFDWDYAALALRGASGEPIAPRWTTARVPRHPECAVCRS